MFNDFKKFILRGNTVDLAVAVVIGAAFGAIVTALVKDMITPLIQAITGGNGKTAFADSSFELHGATFMYGDFINAVISFLLIATVVFFFVVQPVNKLMTISNRKQETPDPTTKKCPECMSEVPIKATRCAFCTSKIK